MTKYKKTLTSGAKKTSVGNDVVYFNVDQDSATYTINVQYLSFQTFDKPCSIKLNDESTIHWIDVNTEFIISDFYVSKFTIIDANVTYYWTAMSID